eukprot:PITA_25290
MNSIFLVLSLASSFKREVHQMDVKSTFLHGDLHEEIYMEQPHGFIQIDSSLVCQLKKSLYGLKQAPRAWHAKMYSFLLDNGFSRCHSDNTIYTNKVGKSLIILILYVDDLILTVLKSKEGISISQSKYACDLLRHFHTEECKPTPSPFHFGAKISVTCTFHEVDATLYHQLVGKLLYLTHTRPNHSFVIGIVARFMKNPLESHWKANKRILCYVRGYVFTLGSGPITRDCKKKSAISLSLVEEEYRGIIEASKKAQWLHQILSEFGFQQQHPTTLWCDNQSAIQLCKYQVQHQCDKHIELHMHFIIKLIHDHVLEVQYFSIDDQVVDIFTKALTEAKFTKLRLMVRVQEVFTKWG